MKLFRVSLQIFAAALLAQSLSAFAAVPATPISPSEIRGVKWTPVDEAKRGDLRFDTAGLNADQFLDLLHAKGINSIVMKVVDIDNQIPSSVGSESQKLAARNAEIARTLKVLKNHSKEWHVFLWKREWLQKGRRELRKSEFQSDMGGIINSAKSGGYDDIIEGIMPIETNLDNSEAVLRYAVEMAADINSETNGWLKGKTFFFPGAGMGAYFAGIDTAWKEVEFRRGIRKQSDFFSTIRGQVRQFSFIVKNMPSQPSKVNRLDRYSSTFVMDGKSRKGWTELGSSEKAGYANSVEATAARGEFINEVMGFKDLVSFLKQTDQSSVRNVIYWGDANEGMTANQRSMWFHQTWHQLMVKEQSFKGHFTYYPVLNESGQLVDEFHRRKFLFQVQTRAGVKELINRGSGWNNWTGWSNPNYKIEPTDSAN